LARLASLGDQITNKFINMNQKGFTNIILVIAVVILVGAVGYFNFVKKSTPNTSQQTSSTASNYKTYTNEKYHFKLRIPENLVAITQNDSQDLSDFLFIDQSDLKKIEKDPLFKTNPFLVALNNNIGGLHLFRNTSSWVAKSKEADIKLYLSAPAGGPHGEVEVMLKDFTKIVGGNGQTIYLYTQELKTEPGMRDIGALWIRGGVMYTLTGLSRENMPSKDTLRAVAESFTEVK